MNGTRYLIEAAAIATLVGSIVMAALLGTSMVRAQSVQAGVPAAEAAPVETETKPIDPPAPGASGARMTVRAPGSESSSPAAADHGLEICFPTLDAGTVDRLLEDGHAMVVAQVRATSVAGSPHPQLLYRTSSTGAWSPRLVGPTPQFAFNIASTAWPSKYVGELIGQKLIPAELWVSFNHELEGRIRELADGRHGVLQLVVEFKGPQAVIRPMTEGGKK